MLVVFFSSLLYLFEVKLEWGNSQTLLVVRLIGALLMPELIYKCPSKYLAFGTFRNVLYRSTSYAGALVSYALGLVIY